MDRREFSRIAFGSLTSIAASGAVPAATALALADLVSDRAAAAAVGSIYLERFPESAARERLLAELALAPELAHASQLAAAIACRIQSDFANQRVIVLDGWLMARSEAIVCGLIALG